MKKLIIILVIFITSINGFVQAQDCIWANSAGGNSDDRSNGSCTDAIGNVYVTGQFSSPTITFGTITLTNVNNGGNSPDLFILKYSPDGTVLWAISAGGSSYDVGYGVSTDASGNVYLTGYFLSPTITFGTTTLTSTGAQDIFIVKYSADGVVLWANSAGGTRGDSGQSICTDTSGNVYVTGFSRSISIAFGTTTLTNSGNDETDETFIVKYDSNGTLLWARLLGGDSYEVGNSVCTDSNGNAYITGYYTSDTITVGTINLINTGSYEIFIVKYSPEGTVLWAKSEGGWSNDYGESVSTDANGNVYLTGSFESTTMTFGTTTLTSAGGKEIYVVKYDSNGTVLWARSAGGTSYDIGKSINIDANNNIYIVGLFGSPTITLDTNNLINSGNGNTSDIFLLKYDTNGTLLWAISAGGANNDYSTSISTDFNGNAYLTGFFGSPTITFGGISLGNAGSSDFFIAKYNGILTGENLENDNEELSIFPNPASSSIMLSIPTLQNSEILISTLAGNKVGTYSTQNISNNKIDISHLAEGIYFVTVKSENGVITKKIIKRE